MTYLEQWFDFNRRQVEIETCIEQTISEQSDQTLTLKEFYLLHFLNQAPESLWDRLPTGQTPSGAPKCSITDGGTIRSQELRFA